MEFKNEYCYVPESSDCRVESLTHGRHTDVSDITMIAMPINITNTHWVCGVINIATQTVEIWDSFDVGNEVVEKIGDAMILWIEDVRKEKLLTPIKFQFKKHTAPRQTNAYDCGVYALLCMQATLRGLEKTYGKDEAKLFRQTMQQGIQDHAVRPRL